MPVSGEARSIGLRVLWAVLPVLSVAAFLGLWELISRTGVVSATNLPAPSTFFPQLWDMVVGRSTDVTQLASGQTSFWGAVGRTVRGWAIGLGLATALAVPIGIVLGASDFVARAFRVPIEFLRPIPSAVLIPLLFFTLGIGLNSEIFLATFGAFWPLLVQTMYGVHDADPVALDTARSFGVGRFEQLYRITLPSAVPYIVTGIRISSNVALILAFTAELFGIGTPGLGALENYAQSYGLTPAVYAIAASVVFLGLVIHLLLSAVERRVLRWHPSQRAMTQ